MLERDSTQEIVDKPRHKRDVRCKWMFTMKYKASGLVDTHKASLVAKGYS